MVCLSLSIGLDLKHSSDQILLIEVLHTLSLTYSLHHSEYCTEESDITKGQRVRSIYRTIHNLS